MASGGNKRQSSLLSFVRSDTGSKRSKNQDGQSLSQSNIPDADPDSASTVTVLTLPPSPSSIESTPPPMTTQLNVQSSDTAGASTVTVQSAVPEDIAKDKVEKPVQPEDISYPYRAYGSVKRSFQSSWYLIYPWLEYSVSYDKVYCFPCRFFGVMPDPTLTKTGFNDWKHGRGKRGTLTIHEFSTKHKEATLSWKAFQSSLENDTSIANQLEKGRKKTVQENRQYVMHLMEVLLCCAQQGIPLRGHREATASGSDEEHDVNLGNFLTFLQLHSRHIELLKTRLSSGPRNATLLSHDYQNSMIAVLAQSVLESIMNEIKSACHYTLIVDETKDISKKEQLTLILRYVFKGVVHERFISYSYCEEVHAAALTSYIYQALDKVGLSITDCVCQCYDGASVMSGCLTGVRARILEDNPRAIYIHCHAHQLNLALVDSCRSLPHASEFFALLETLYVYMASTVPHSVFLQKQKELNINEIRLVKLSDTRWSCRYASIKAVKSTILAIQAALDELADGTGTRAIEARGLLHQVNSFSFILTLLLFERVFSITANLSNLLQSEQLNYASAARCIKATKSALSALRSETEWQLVWDAAMELGESLNIAVTPNRPRRQRRTPAVSDDFVVDESIGSRDNVSEYRTSVYYSTLDTLLADLNDRFNETNISILQSLQSLVPTSESFLQVTPISPFLHHYGIDFAGYRSEVTTAIAFLKDVVPLSSIHHVYSHLYEAKECFPCLLQTLQIAMTIGVTTASAERSFSSLRRLKTYLRSTMSQDRLNNLALLHIERDQSTKLWDCLEDQVMKFAQLHKNSRVLLQ